MLKSYGYWWLECVDKNNIWCGDFQFDPVEKKWVTFEDAEDNTNIKWYPSVCYCHSLKAAKRHIKKHNEIPKGTKFELVSRSVEAKNIQLIKR